MGNRIGRRGSWTDIRSRAFLAGSKEYGATGNRLLCCFEAGVHGVKEYSSCSVVALTRDVEVEHDEDVGIRAGDGGLGESELGLGGCGGLGEKFTGCVDGGGVEDDV